MNTKLVLIKCITLLLCESLIEDKKDKSKELTLQAMGYIKLPEVGSVINTEYDVIDGLRRLVIEMANDPVDHIYDIPTVIQNVRIICIEERSLFEAFQEAISKIDGQESIKRMCVNARRSLNKFFKEEKIVQTIEKAQKKIRFERDKITDFDAFAQETITELESVQGTKDDKDPAILAEVSTSNRESLIRAFENVKDQESGAAVFKTGVQALNRMTANQIRRTMTVLISALQHNFKTGFTTNLFRQFVTYNEPVLKDRTKIPCAAFIGFEDDIENYMRMLYIGFRCNETRAPIPKEELESKKAEEIADYVMACFAKTGFEVKIICVDPSRWTYRDIQNKVQEWESDGYEIQILGLDYLAMVPTIGCVQGPFGVDKRDLFRRLRNFCRARGTLLITPHQISTEGKQLIRDGKDAATFVKDIAGKGYYEGSKQIDQEVDLELYIHIVKFGGRTYLAVQRGKHRGIVGQTPDDDLYTLIPFMDGHLGYNCGILDDINHEDSSLRRLGAAPGKNGEPAWWDSDI